MTMAKVQASRRPQLELKHKDLNKREIETKVQWDHVKNIWSQSQVSWQIATILVLRRLR